MEKITFECETITPMFCYGADQTTPEIRAASIKGAMRFWWRALHPDLVKEGKDEKPDYSELRKQETELFGGAGDGDAMRSSFTVRVLYDKTEKIPYQPLPHHDNSDCCSNCEKNEKTKKCKKSYENSAKMGTFDIEMTFISTKNKDLIQNLFILFSILGGIGKRSRKGFGSFRILQITTKEKTEEFKYEVTRENLENTAKIVNNKFVFNSNRNDSYPYLKNVEIGKTDSSIDDLLKRIGTSSHENNSDCTGFVNGSKRFGSPLVLSIFKDLSNKSKIILSELNCSPEHCSKTFCSHGKRFNFIKEVLS